MKKIAVNDNLPNKISELLFLAIKDMRKIEDDGGYGFDMGVYTNEIINGLNERICLVCMAGAVMVKTLNMPKDIGAIPRSFENTKIDDKLRAINKLVNLFVVDAFCTLEGCAIQGFYNAIPKANFDAKLDKIIIQYINETSDVECVGDIINNGNQHLDFYREFSGLLKEMGL